MEQYVKDLLEGKRNELIQRRQRSEQSARHHRDSAEAATRDAEDAAAKQTAIEAVLFVEVVDL